MHEVMAMLVSIAFVICLLSFFVWYGVVMAQDLDAFFKQTGTFCNDHPEVEMWDTSRGIVNCSIMREGKMVAI
jgi:hypothetical protein